MEIKVVDLSLEYVNQVVEICDVQLGKGYITKKNLTSMLNDDERYIIKIALNDDNSVIGYSMAFIINSNEIEAVLKLPYDLIIKYFDKTKNKKIGILKTTVIKKGFEKKGIGTKIGLSRIEELNNRGIKKLSSIAWKSKQGINANNLLKKFNLKAIGEVSNFWEIDSIKENYYCSDCKEPPCKCSAVIYVNE